jgi:hypothetical protein
MKILFLHGWTSKPGGRKPTFLKEQGHEVFNPALPDGDFDEAVRLAQAEFDQHHPDVVVGSSRGGAVAMNIKSNDIPLVLLCPAWKKYGSATTVKSNTVVLHSRQDDVVPFADSEKLVAKSDLPRETLIEIGIDHRFADEDPLSAMLKACKRDFIQLVGIDPGSGKGLMVWMDDAARKKKPLNAKAWISQLRENHKDLLICWDSPLSFNSELTLSYRSVEKVLKVQVGEWVEDEQIERKAVSVQPFCGCSHWVISCEALGQPFARSGIEPIPIATSVEDVKQGGEWLIESHPAVAMAIWWIDGEYDDPFPIYKPHKQDVCKHIAETLGFQELCALEEVTDDMLDAYVAHRLAQQFMTGQSQWIGDHLNGGFILPVSAETTWSLHEKVQLQLQLDRS